MKTLLLAPLLLFCLPAFAFEFAITEEGVDKGYRLTARCFLSGEMEDCPIDTGAPFSVVRLSDRNKDLPSLQEEDIGSIGLAMHCSQVMIPDFEMFGMGLPDQIFHRCAGLPSVTTLIGMNFFLGHSFRLDFSRADLALDTEYSGPQEKLERNPSTGSGKLIIAGMLAEESISLAFDTGAPVSMVDQRLIDKYPQIFVESKRPPSEMMKRRGLRRYEMHWPFVVNGIRLEAEYVYGADVRGFSKYEYPVLLGVNHMKNANWYFDLVRKTWAIYR